jgi:hypothetical protein
MAAGCSKDNYDKPESFLTGRIVYENTPLNLRGTGQAIVLQMYQHGYAYFNPINIYVGQDGSFSAALFNGDYLLVTRDGNGPWVNSRDSVKISIKGHTSIDLEVTPYFTISDENISVSGSKLNISFHLRQVVPAANISRVMLLLNNTQFVDDINNIFRRDFADVKTGSVLLEMDIPTNSGMSDIKALFARICVWAEGADQGIYSSVIRLK